MNQQWDLDRLNRFTSSENVEKNLKINEKPTLSIKNSQRYFSFDDAT